MKYLAGLLLLSTVNIAIADTTTTTTITTNSDNSSTSTTSTDNTDSDGTTVVAPIGGTVVVPGGAAVGAAAVGGAAAVAHPAEPLNRAEHAEQNSNLQNRLHEGQGAREGGQAREMQERPNRGGGGMHRR